MCDDHVVFVFAQPLSLSFPLSFLLSFCWSHCLHLPVFPLQIFHMCDEDGRRIPYMCGNNTSFNQKFRVCDWNYNVDCPNSPDWSAVPLLSINFVKSFIFQFSFIAKLR